MKTIFMLAIVGWSSVTYAMCYSVYDESNTLIYQSTKAPVDLSGSTTVAVQKRFPGASMMIQNVYCSEYDKVKADAARRAKLAEEKADAARRAKEADLAETARIAKKVELAESARQANSIISKRRNLESTYSSADSSPQSSAYSAPASQGATGQRDYRNEARERVLKEMAKEPVLDRSGGYTTNNPIPNSRQNADNLRRLQEHQERQKELAADLLAIESGVTPTARSRGDERRAQERAEDSKQKSIPTPLITPSNMASCDSGGCWDRAGTRYNGNPKGTMTRTDGKVCRNNGAMVHCD